jgi:hypothetical protein
MREGTRHHHYHILALLVFGKSPYSGLEIGLARLIKLPVAVNLINA